MVALGFSDVKFEFKIHECTLVMTARMHPVHGYPSHLFVTTTWAPFRYEIISTRGIF